MTRWRWLPILVAATLGATTVPVLAAPVGGHLDPRHRVALAAPVFVDLFKSAGRARGSGPKSAKGPTQHQALTHHALPLSPQSGTSTKAAILVQDAAFPLDSLDQQVATFGASQTVAPPDTMVAAGPTALLELVNRTASVWSKTGSLMAMVNLNNLPMPTGYVFSDPRVLFDAVSGRFILTGSATDRNNDSVVELGVSKGSDPLGGFSFYPLAPTANGELHDQPKVGVSDDKVVIAWDDFMPGSVYVGSEAWVLQKSALLASSSAPIFVIGPTLGLLSPVPVQSLTSTTTQYLVHDAGSSVTVMSITGTPAQNNVAETMTSVPMPVAYAPPPASQPGGGYLNTGDNRFLSAVWQNGTLWTSANVGCQHNGSAGAHPCLRLVELSTGDAPSLVRSLNVGPAALDVYYPAVTVDGNGDLFISFTVSSQSLYASAAIAELTAGPAPAASGAIFMQGSQAYPNFLWGDFSSISIDPTTGGVWAAAEYAPTGSNADWGTAGGLYTP